jgi:glycosyltransferase involved in cell wall biosynthesis
LHSAFCVLNSRHTLRIGFDGRGFSSPAAGIRRYSTELVTALAELDEPLEIVALGGDPASIPSGIERVDESAHPRGNAGWTLIGLPRTAARARVRVIHAPAYTAPFWAGVPVVLTIHDVSYETHPEWYPYRRDWLRRFYYRRSARAAHRIVTVSAFSAGEIVAAYGIARERITVVPLGVRASFAAGDSNLPLDLPANVTEPFLLHVGDIHERRNLALVVDALLEARRHFGAAAALSLVLAGVDRGVTDGLCAMAADAGSPAAVVALGTVSEDRVHALYRAATALVYPSLYEGFGLPLIEAMASGTPVLASHEASIPEVLGGAGLLLDARSVSAWRDAIIRVVNDESLRDDLRARGLARAATYTWQRTARLTLDVYREAARAA